MILNGKTVDLKEDISVEQLLKDYDLNPSKSRCRSKYGNTRR